MSNLDSLMLGGYEVDDELDLMEELEEEDCMTLTDKIRNGIALDWEFDLWLHNLTPEEEEQGFRKDETDEWLLPF